MKIESESERVRETSEQVVKKGTTSDEKNKNKKNYSILFIVYNMFCADKKCLYSTKILIAIINRIRK